MLNFEDGHPNRLEPGKRPRTTLINYIVSKDGVPVMTVGCPGGDHQAQANLQLILNSLLWGMNPQAAVEAPRFASNSVVNSFYPHSYFPGQLAVERGIPQNIRNELAAKGHDITRRRRRRSRSHNLKTRPKHRSTFNLCRSTASLLRTVLVKAIPQRQDFPRSRGNVRRTKGRVVRQSRASGPFSARNIYPLRSSSAAWPDCCHPVRFARAPPLPSAFPRERRKPAPSSPRPSKTSFRYHRRTSLNTRTTMKILGICGSLRKESWNLKLLKNMLEAITSKGAETAIFDLNSVPMFHPDVEAQGIPAEAETFRDAVRGADAIIIACPEYNGSMTATLKNAIEWLSRRGNLMTDKVFFIIGTGPRTFGMSAHAHARVIQRRVGRRLRSASTQSAPAARRQLHE